MRVIVSLPDEAEADLMAFAFRRRGHQVYEMGSARALQTNVPFPPNVMILGVDESENSVERVAEARARYGDALLLAVAERPREPLPAQLIKAGIDEVVRSPYNPNEVTLRCESYLQRTPAATADESLKVGDLSVELSRYFAHKNGVPLTLTKLEIRLLHCLCEHHPRLAPMERLLTFGWEDEAEPDPSLIKTHISHIRRKLEAAGGVPIQVISRQGVGYTLICNEN